MSSQELGPILIQLTLIFMLAPIAVVMVLVKNDQDKRRHAREQQRVLERIRLERSQARLETEAYTRRQLAADLHDELGLHFNLILHALREAAKKMTGKSQQDLSAVITQSEYFYQRMRDLVYRIKRQDLLQNGLLPAMHDVVRDVKNLGRFALHFDHPQSLPPLDADQNLFLLCMLQEGLNNVIKHAHAQSVQVALTMEDHLLTLRITDDGKGFDTSVAATGHGLDNIRQRSQLLGGTFTIHTPPSGGSKLIISVPLGTNTTQNESQRKPTPLPAYHSGNRTGGLDRQPPDND